MIQQQTRLPIPGTANLSDCFHSLEIQWKTQK